MSRRHKKRHEFRFERIVERDSVKHDLAEQTLRLDRQDRDILYYSGNLRQVNNFDALCEEYRIEIRREENRKARQRRLGV